MNIFKKLFKGSDIPTNNPGTWPASNLQAGKTFNLIKTHNLKPGETLIFLFPDPEPSIERAEAMKERIRKSIPDGVKLLIIWGNVSIQHLRNAK